MERAAALIAVLALAACSGGEDEAATSVEVGDQSLACAIGQGSQYSDSCTLQKFEREGETIYRVNHPGGGFRLFTVAADGSGMVSHDGAEQAVNRLDGDRLEVTVGEDRYRFAAKASAK